MKKAEQHVETIVGDNILDVCAELVRLRPARADFNGRLLWAGENDTISVVHERWVRERDAEERDDKVNAIATNHHEDPPWIYFVVDGIELGPMVPDGPKLSLSWERASFLWSVLSRSSRVVGADDHGLALARAEERASALLTLRTVLDRVQAQMQGELGMPDYPWKGRPSANFLAELRARAERSSCDHIELAGFLEELEAEARR